MDKVLQRLELENRKTMLEAIKENLLKEGMEIKTNRGIYIIKGRRALLEIESCILEELEEIDIQLEKLTGLDQDKMDKYYKIVEV